MNALVLGDLSAQPFSMFPLSGCTSIEQLEENLQAGELVLDPEVLGYLERGT